MLSAIDPENGPHRGLLGETPFKNMSFWPFRITENVYLCVRGFISQHERALIDLWERVCKKQSKNKKTHLWPPFGPVSTVSMLKALWDSAPHWFPLKSTDFSPVKRNQLTVTTFCPLGAARNGLIGIQSHVKWLWSKLRALICSASYWPWWKYSSECMFIFSERVLGKWGELFFFAER